MAKRTTTIQTFVARERPKWILSKALHEVEGDRNADAPASPGAALPQTSGPRHNCPSVGPCPEHVLTTTLVESPVWETCYYATAQGVNGPSSWKGTRLDQDGPGSFTPLSFLNPPFVGAGWSSDSSEPEKENRDYVSYRFAAGGVLRARLRIGLQFGPPCSLCPISWELRAGEWHADTPSFESDDGVIASGTIDPATAVLPVQIEAQWTPAGGEYVQYYFVVTSPQGAERTAGGSCTGACLDRGTHGSLKNTTSSVFGYLSNQYYELCVATSIDYEEVTDLPPAGSTVTHEAVAVGGSGYITPTPARRIWDIWYDNLPADPAMYTVDPVDSSSFTTNATLSPDTRVKVRYQAR